MGLASIRVVAAYEWRRALARRKVALLVVFTLVVEFLPFLVLNLLPIPGILEGVTNMMWFVGAIVPHFFFLQFTALLIGSGATAEEYEQGTADIILAKPISRTSYQIGKFLGGLTLYSFIALLTTVFAIALSTLTFGAQINLQFAPVIYLSIVFSTLVFFSLGFVSGEIFRSPGLAYLVSSSIFITSFIMLPFLVLANSLTGAEIYLSFGRALPTWSVQNLPLAVAEVLFSNSNGFLSVLSFGPVIEGTLSDAIIGVGTYTLVGVSIAFVRFLRTDVTKKSTT
jgi:ABC-2 type transport system permease protein